MEGDALGVLQMQCLLEQKSNIKKRKSHRLRRLQMEKLQGVWYNYRF